MRFALIATTVAAAVAVPFAVSASGPQMSSEQFLSAVRCAAYQDVTRSDAALNEVKYELNAEALRQAPETAAEARAEVSSIAREAVSAQTPADADMLRQERAAACSGVQLTGADSRDQA
jgi:hypothetical protein